MEPTAVHAKKLTANQVESLFVFTRRHFVEHYDLQCELADHLANAIEARWEQQPSLTFDEALSIEFKKFGVFGFMDIVEKKQSALSKKYYGLVWRYFKDFFKLPRLMLTIALMGIYFTLLQAIPYRYEFALVVFIVLILAWICGAVQLKLSYRKKSRQEGRKWLLEEIIFNVGAVGLIVLPQLFLRVFSTESRFDNVYFIAGCAVGFVLLGICNT